MLGALFSKIWEMTIWGSYSIIVVLIVRLFLRRCDRKYAYYLWLVAFLNLCIPFSIKGTFSLFPTQLAEWQETGSAQTGEASDHAPGESETVYIFQENTVDTANVTYMSENVKMPPTQTTGRKLSRWDVAGIVWCIGAACLLLYNIMVFLKMQKKLRNAGTGRGGIRELDGIGTPFLWGILRPAIYIPKGMGETERTYIVAHELCHKKRKDYIIKPVLYLIVILHWFNPLVWLAYRLCVRDMEISCDERVLSDAAQRGEDIKKQYAQSLFQYALKQNGYVMTPLTFGEPSVKERIQSVLRYHKKGAAATALALVCVVLITAGLVVKPKAQEQGETAEQETAAQEDAAQNVPGEEETLFIYGYTGYLDEFTSYSGWEQFVDCDYDGDGLTDRVYREEAEDKVSYRIEFGNGDWITLRDYFNEHPVIQAVDLTGDGVREIIISSACWFSTDPEGSGVAAVFRKTADGQKAADAIGTGFELNSGYESMPLPFDDSGEYGGGAPNVSPCINLHYEQADDCVRITADRPQIEEYAVMDESIRSDLFFLKDGSIEDIVAEPYEVEILPILNSRALLKFYFEAFGKWSNYRIAVTVGYQNGALEAFGYEFYDWLADSDQPAAQEDASEGEAAVSVDTEGTVEEVPAEAYETGDFYILIPIEGWRRTGPDLWTCTENDSVRLWVADMELPTLDKAREALMVAGYQKTPESLLFFYKTQDGEKECVWLVAGEETVWSVRYRYPDTAEYEEGFGSRLQAIAATFSTQAPYSGADRDAVKAIADIFSKAYFARDEETMKSCLLEDGGGIELYDGTPETVEIVRIKGLDNVESAEDCSISVEFWSGMEGDDSLTYLTLGFVKTEDGWKIEWYGLEK